MDRHRSKEKDDGSVVMSISGMTCSGCANTVTRILSRVPGVIGVNVDLGSGRATVIGEVRSAALIAVVQAAGYGAQLSQHDTATGESSEFGGSSCC